MLRPRQSRVLVWMFGGVVAAAFSAIVKPGYQLRYNTSRSAPLGWYVIVPVRELPVGAFALARLPEAAALLADRRHYLPCRVPLLKQVTAIHGQLVCSGAAGRLQIDGVITARALTRDSAGRSLEAWAGCRPLAADEVLLLNPANSASFDSRYFGPIRRADIIGQAIPLWTW